LTTYALARRRTAPLVSAARPTGAIRRVFDNSQLIERFGKWLLICGRAENTRVNYESHVEQFSEFLKGQSLTSVTRMDIQNWLAHLCTRNLKPVTMATKLFALRTFYDFLQMGDQVRTSVPRYVATRKVPQRLPHTKSEEEIERLIAAAGNPRDLAILELAYASGLRVNELACLRVEDVNIRARSLVVRQGKGGNDRIGLFGRSAADALRAYLGGRTTGSVFQPLPPRRQRGGISRGRFGDWWGYWRETDPSGKRVMRTVRLGDYDLPTKERARLTLDAFLAHKLPQDEPEAPQRGLTTRQIHRIIARTARRAGIGHVHPHVLRHSMATHCLNRGMDIRFVQELLGHTSLVATQKYLSIAIDKLQQTYAKFHPHAGE